MKSKCIRGRARIIFLALIGLCIFGCKFHPEHGALTEFGGIKLGQTREEVLRRIGQPMGDPNGKTLIYPDKASHNQEQKYAVGFWEGRVKHVSYFGVPVPTSVSVLSIRLGDSQAKVEKDLGKAEFVSVEEGTHLETHTYKKQGVVLICKDGVVMSLGITNLLYGPVRYIKEERVVDRW